MLKKILIAIVGLIFAYWILALESSLLPLFFEVCEKGKDSGTEQCATYNFVSYALYKLVGFLDSINTVITAVSTAAVAIFTYTLWRSTRGMLEATSSSIELGREELRLSRDEFISSHPPKIIVRDILVWQNSECERVFNGEFVTFKPGEKLTGHLILINAGGSKATIEVAYRMVDWRSGKLPMRALYASKTIPFMDPPITLAPGEGVQLTPITCEKVMGDEASYVAIGYAGWRLYVMGFVRYRDDIGIVRHMNFCREWVYDELRFNPAAHPDYEREY